MGKPMPESEGEAIEIDIRQIARMAMENRPLTESEARAAVQEAIQRMYPDLEQAALIFSGVWQALKLEAEAEHRDVVQVLESAATDNVSRVLRIDSRPTVISETVTVGADGLPMDALGGRLSPSQPQKGKLVFAMPMGWLYVVLAFILGICFTVIVYAVVSRLVMGR